MNKKSANVLKYTKEKDLDQQYKSLNSINKGFSEFHELIVGL